MPADIPSKLSIRNQLIIDGMAQVKLIAAAIHRRLPKNVNLDDLISAGTIGLITAVDRYDPEQGFKLKTYAEYKIRGAILDSLRCGDWAPRLQRRRARLIKDAATLLEKQLQREPSEEEMAAELGISIDEYRHWKKDNNTLTVMSLDNGKSNENGSDLLQLIADNDQSMPLEVLEQSELRKLVCQATERMPQKERIVLAMYYHDGLTLREISRTLGLHESRISQLKTQAVLRLRNLLLTKWPNRGQIGIDHGSTSTCADVRA
jgi:RNA polymerase sigma factor FliA